MIELKEVDKYFSKNKPAEVHAVKQLSLTIQKGEYVIILGANGSGKSTLLNLIAGTERPSFGGIFIDGRNVTALHDYQRSRYIARVFQNPLSGTASDLTVLDNFRLAAIRTKSKTLGIGTTKTFKDYVVERISSLGMGLESKLTRPMGSLSGGQRQALTLLMSVMDDCSILLLDEPTAALDPRTADMIMRITDNLVQVHKLTAVLVTHNLKQAAQYGDRIIQMNDGSIVRDVTGQQKRQLSLPEMANWFQ